MIIIHSSQQAWKKPSQLATKWPALPDNFSILPDNFLVLPDNFSILPYPITGGQQIFFSQTIFQYFPRAYYRWPANFYLPDNFSFHTDNFSILPDNFSISPRQKYDSPRQNQCINSRFPASSGFFPCLEYLPIAFFQRTVEISLVCVICYSFS